MGSVYVVYGNLDRDNDCDYKIHGVFYTRKSAEDFMISIARTAFDELDVPRKRRECWYEDGLLSGVFDNMDWLVELLIKEIETQE